MDLTAQIIKHIQKKDPEVPTLDTLNPVSPLSPKEREKFNSVNAQVEAANIAIKAALSAADLVDFEEIGSNSWFKGEKRGEKGGGLGMWIIRSSSNGLIQQIRVGRVPKEDISIFVSFQGVDTHNHAAAELFYGQVIDVPEIPGVPELPAQDLGILITADGVYMRHPKSITE